MGPAVFIIAILGCADGAAECTPVATLPVRYESEATCVAATGGALADARFDFPTIVAECRTESRLQSERDPPQTSRVGRGGR